KAGWAAAQGKLAVVALNTELNEGLLRRGIAKDAVRLIQDLRKKRNCNFTDRIHIWIDGASESIRDAIAENEQFICQETLTVQVNWGASPAEWLMEAVELDDLTIQLGLKIDA
ncbi:MAG: DUF5915 domain-containing protein, partial [Pirellula sp.]|nr:DUF5915 domain-containing protein [Pirellula sp.]